MFPTSRRRLRGARARLGRGSVIVLALGGLGLLAAACASSPTSSIKSTTTTSAGSTTATTQASTSTSTTSTATIANCTTAQLQVTAGTSNGAAGTIGQIVLFTNTSATTCLLHGFPGVAGLDATGTQVAQATRVVDLQPFTGPLSSLPTVTLAPSATASALVFGSDVPTGTATTCSNYTALLVTPPNASQSARVTVTMPGCAGLRVGPVYPGNTGMA